MVDYTRCAFELEEFGITKLSFGETNLWKKFHTARLEFKEFLPVEKILTRQDVMGGWGALGNPSSFHHPQIRAWRIAAKKHMMEIARRMNLPDEARLECLFERMSLRSQLHGTVRQIEPHRELRNLRIDMVRIHNHRATPADDIIIGGWINCNDPAHFDRVQTFRSYWGTHHTDQPVDREFQPTVTNVYCCEMILYNQNLVREFKCEENNQYNPHARMMVGFRITIDDKPMYPVDAIIDDQDVPFIPTGQKAQMVSFMHMVKEESQQKVRNFALTLKPQYRHPPIQGNDFEMPCRDKTFAMDSLRKYGDMFPPYTAEERTCMYPEHISNAESRIVDDTVGGMGKRQNQGVHDSVPGLGALDDA